MRIDLSLPAALLALVIFATCVQAHAAEAPTDCDRLAGEPNDPHRIAEGVGRYGIDETVAVPACEKAVADDPGNARLLYELGRAYQARAIGDHNMGPADKFMTAAAAKGYPAAVIEAGILDWWSGSPEQAEKKFEEAAHSMPRIAKATRAAQIGEIALETEPKETLKHFVEALAEHGDAEAIYWSSIPLGWDPGRAKERIRLLKQAAALGHPQATIELARLYAQGKDGLEANLEESVRLLRVAEASGDAGALRSLSHFYRDGRFGLPQDSSKASALLQKASSGGDNAARVQLAEAYEHGEAGMARDPKESARLYKLAADDGNADAVLALARFMREGLGGFAPDRPMAAAYLKRAARWSDEAAKALKATGEAQ